MTCYGVDVSYYQGSINWSSVRSAGISFATIKATAGSRSLSMDSGPYFRSQFPRLKSSGIPLIGGYHWLKASHVVSVADQVDYFLDQWSAVGGYQGHIVQLDWEDTGARPSWSTGLAWLAEWRRRANNYPVIVYIPDWYYAGIPGRRSLTELKAPIWSSEYVSSSGSLKSIYPGNSANQWHSYGGVSPTILQYSERSRVSGVSGDCDANAYKGTITQLRSLLTTGSSGSGLFTDLDLS